MTIATVAMTAVAFASPFEDLAYKSHVASMQTACVVRLKQVVRDLGVTRNAPSTRTCILEIDCAECTFAHNCSICTADFMPEHVWHAAARV